MPLEGLPTGSVGDLGRHRQPEEDADETTDSQQDSQPAGQAPRPYRSVPARDPVDRTPDGPKAENHPHPATAKRIARLEQQNEKLRSLVDRKDHQLNRVIDYYEGLIQERDERDGHRATPNASGTQEADAESTATGPIAALKRLLRNR